MAAAVTFRVLNLLNIWAENKKTQEISTEISDLLYSLKSTEKNDLRTCLFSSTEKKASYMQK